MKMVFFNDGKRSVISFSVTPNLSSRRCDRFQVLRIFASARYEVPAIFWTMLFLVLLTCVCRKVFQSEIVLKKNAELTLKPVFPRLG